MKTLTLSYNLDRKRLFRINLCGLKAKGIGAI